jgi:DNA repair protein RadA/Sms
VAWFEMSARGLHEIDPEGLLRSGQEEVGAATALPVAGRRGLAVEVQALVAPVDGPGRRQATGLDLRRFQMVAAVLGRIVGSPLTRADLYGASLGGVRIDDPACDLAMAAALASAATGIAPPPEAAFVGEVGLTGLVRRPSAMPQRLAAARAAGCSTVFAAVEPASSDLVRIVPVRRVLDALGWITDPAAGTSRDRLA